MSAIDAKASARSDQTWRTLYLGAPVDMPVLHKGSKGILVEKIQYRLSDAGYYHSIIDGDFGTATEAAVKDLQTYIGLTIDGIVGD
ncbi:peptidoglycan-binding domain-containing protein [Mastigocoleus testarum]|uniref:peptidoglycan-binding domain-containing protein n=1 Tax=Mastigocoleus testarum TaxID=996925 RepID=UPI001379AD2E|nr:peptidoglycan-binding domain-containing protein [Mastigocoleus testarum]